MFSKLINIVVISEIKYIKKPAEQVITCVITEKILYFIIVFFHNLMAIRILFFLKIFVSGVLAFQF